MSGHSKWHNIQARKGKQDAKRSQVFSKLSKAITIAAQRGGGDPETNFSLRIAIDKAKAVSMPKDNIDRAIKKGSGEDGVAQIEEVFYEGYGPGGVALIIKCLTDNRNRTVAEVKHILSKHGGTMGTAGSVMWMFDQCGLIQVESSKISNRENFEMDMIEVGAEDIYDQDGIVAIKTKLENFSKVLNKIKDLGIDTEDSGLRYITKDDFSVSEDVQNQISTLFELLDENEDVDDYFTNAV